MRCFTVSWEVAVLVTFNPIPVQSATSLNKGNKIFLENHQKEGSWVVCDYFVFNVFCLVVHLILYFFVFNTITH